jgi:hypothetical protein
MRGFTGIAPYLGTDNRERRMLGVLVRHAHGVDVTAASPIYTRA